MGLCEGFSDEETVLGYPGGPKCHHKCPIRGRQREAETQGRPREDGGRDRSVGASSSHQEPEEVGRISRQRGPPGGAQPGPAHTLMWTSASRTARINPRWCKPPLGSALFHGPGKLTQGGPRSPPARAWPPHPRGAEWTGCETLGARSWPGSRPLGMGLWGAGGLGTSRCPNASR